MQQILVIEDDPFLRMLVEARIGSADRQLVFAATGAEGLSHLAFTPPGLVILDIGLPDISGLEVLRLLRQAPVWARTPILILTAHSDLDLIVRAKALGATGYVCKPIDPDSLAEMVIDMLSDDSLVWLDDYTKARRPH